MAQSHLYPAGDYPVTPNLGLALYGMDETIAEDFIILDSLFPGGTGVPVIEVNGAVILPTPGNVVNFNSTTPAAPGGKTNVIFQIDASGNVSAYYTPGGGGGSSAFTIVSANTTAIAQIQYFVLCDTSGGGFTVTLIASSAGNAGLPICVKKISSDTNTLTIAAHAGDNIDGQASWTTKIKGTAVLMIDSGTGTWEIY